MWAFKARSGETSPVIETDQSYFVFRLDSLRPEGIPPYEKIKVLLQVPDKPFDEQDIAPPGGSAEQPWMSTADVDGDGKPELLLAQKNFLRAVVWQEETNSPDGKPTYSFRVKDQINGAGSNSRIVGAAALPNGTNRIGSLFLLDAERKSLTLCERDPAGELHGREPGGEAVPLNERNGPRRRALAVGAVGILSDEAALVEVERHIGQ